VSAAAALLMTGFGLWLSFRCGLLRCLLRDICGRGKREEERKREGGRVTPEHSAQNIRRAPATRRVGQDPPLMRAEARAAERAAIAAEVAATDAAAFALALRRASEVDRGGWRSGRGRGAPPLGVADPGGLPGELPREPHQRPPASLESTWA